MKKKILASGILLAASTLGLGAMSGYALPEQKSIPDFGRSVSVKRAATNNADGWVCSNGDSNQLTATNVTGGVKIGNLHAYSAEMRMTEKIALDGLEFTFKNDGACTDGYNSATGFYFSQNEGYEWSKPTFTIWRALYSGQTRVNVASSHDYNEESVVRVAPSVDAKKGFGLASSMVMNVKDNDGFKIKFEHESLSWWKVTFTEIYTGSFWNNNGNYVKEDGQDFATITTYLSNNDMPLDADGKAYFHVIGASNAGGSVTVTDFVEGSFKEVGEGDVTTEEKDNAKAKVNAYDVAEYPESLQENITSLKTQALADIDDAVKPTDLNNVVDTFKAAVKAVYAEYAHYGDDVSEVDSTANFVDPWGQGNFAKRFNDEGGILGCFNAGYGFRGQFARKYNITNFNAKINLSELPTNGIYFLNFSMANGDYFNSTESKYYHIEFLKTTENDYLAILGNTADHNVPISEWSTDTYTQFKGKFVKSVSGIINISMATDFQTGTSTLTINQATAQFPSNRLYRDVAPESDVSSYVQTGVFNTSGNIKVLIEKMEDSASKAYSENLSNTVDTFKNSIAEAKTNTLAQANGELTDETYGTYKDAVNSALETLDSYGGLTAYDYSYYGIGAIATEAKEAINAPVTAYEAKVATAKENAIAKINSYKAEDYREDEQAILAAGQASYIDTINKCTTLGEVEEKLAAAVTGLEGIKTDAQYKLDDAKVAAKNEITNYKNLEDYRDDQVAEIANILKEGKAAIDACETVEAITEKVQEYKTKLDAVKTDAQLTAEEKVAALANAKEEAKTELEGYKNAADYRDAQKTEIQNIVAEGKTAIDACETVEAVAAKLAEYKGKLDAVKTNAQLTEEEKAAALATAKQNAIAEIESYVEDLTKYTKANQDKIAEAIDACKTAINNATDVAGVNAALAEGKAAIDAIPQKKAGCGGSVVAATSLIGMVTLIGAALVAKKNKEN